MFRLQVLRPATSLLALSAFFVASPTLAAEWQTISDYGGSTNMVIYVPDDVDESPGVAVALHSCGNQYEGDSQNYFRSGADEHGFIIIAPTNGQPDCWNATAGQDGEKPDIVKMVEWVIANENADASRVYVGGASSGACMTIAMLSAYPDVFAAGTMMAGVPFGAWSGGGSCGVCSQGAAPKSEQEWGDIVRSNAPDGFSGPWPRLQVWHGDADSTLVYGWASETEKQWKNVLGLTADGAEVTGPSGWNRTEYEDGGQVVLQVNRGPGKDHYLPDDIPQEEMIAFFGLDQEGADPVGTGGSSGSGGAAAGGTSAGGAAAGGSSAGGTSAGGSTAAGGATGDGGTANSAGGVSADGGASAGGTTSAGGATAAGGAVPPTMGGGDDGGGCTFGTGRVPAFRGLWAFLMATVLGFGLVRRRKSSN